MHLERSSDNLLRYFAVKQMHRMLICFPSVFHPLLIRGENNQRLLICQSSTSSFGISFKKRDGRWNISP